MKSRFLLMVGATVILCACEPTAEEQEKVQRVLPAGCSIHDLGSYGAVNHLVVVRCDGKPTQTGNFRLPHGRTSHTISIVTIE